MAKTNRATNATPQPAWMTNGRAVYLAGQAAIDGVDHVASECELRWGVGRLRLLVSNDLRTKFDAQREKLDHAIWHGDLDAVKTECERMCNAWRFLDAAATQAGAEPLSPVVWEFELSSGIKIALVRTLAESHHVAKDRTLQVWSLDEVARCIEAFPEAVKAKDTFNDARVVRAERHPKTETAEVIQDEIPF